MIILSGDIGSANYAHSIIQVDLDSKEKYTLVKSKYLKLTHPEMGHRLLEILKQLKADIQEFKPDKLVYEDSKFSGKHAPSLHFVCGLYHLCSATFNTELHKFSPTAVKKKLTGNGKADKKQVEEAVINLLSNPPENGFDNDHLADSIGIGLCLFL